HGRDGGWTEIRRGAPRCGRPLGHRAPVARGDGAELVRGGSGALVRVGSGRSRLADRLLGAGYEEITLLDVSGDAIAETRARLGSRAPQVRFVVGDVLDWRPLHRYDVWHDRALFHFLTDPSDRARYVAVLRAAVRVGGHVVIATFAPSGPESCSGLPVVRYDAEGLQRALGTSFRLVRAEEAAHRTPSGGVQPF